MGINGLWEKVKAAQLEDSLIRMATVEGFQWNKEKRSLVVGVDTSLWIDSAQAAFQGATIHTHPGENPEIRTFYYKLCHYLRNPLILVFVLEGGGRPSIKRGRQVKAQPLWVMSYVEELVTAFGFYVHQAPGEAEAELARLNSSGMIDAILTDDSDTLVFGGQCIIRRSPSAKTGDYDSISVYTSESIENCPNVELTRGGLLLVALLAGGDYDDGINGCGAGASLALARCGFGDELLQAAESESQTPGSLPEFLCNWRARIRSELRTNMHGYMKSRMPRVAENIKEDFPKLKVLDLYLNPLTSWSSQPGCRIPDSTQWWSREPVIPRITAFCVERFGWGRDGKIMSRLHSTLWEGVAFRMLCSGVVLYSSKTHLIATPATNARLLSQTNSKTRLSRLIPLRRITVSTENFRTLMGAAWTGSSTAEGSKTISLQVPLAVLQTHVPLVLQFQPNIQKRSPASPAASGMVVPKKAEGSRQRPMKALSTGVIELTDSSSEESEEDLRGAGAPHVHAVRKIRSPEVIEIMDSDDEASVIDLTRA